MDGAARIRSAASTSMRRIAATNHNPGAVGRAAPRPSRGGVFNGEGLRELRVDGANLIFAPLDGRLEIHLVGAELRRRVDHDELLIDLVRSGRARPRVAHREVIL